MSKFIEWLYGDCNEYDERETCEHDFHNYKIAEGDWLDAHIRAFGDRGDEL